MRTTANKAAARTVPRVTYSMLDWARPPVRAHWLLYALTTIAKRLIAGTIAKALPTLCHNETVNGARFQQDGQDQGERAECAGCAVFHNLEPSFGSVPSTEPIGQICQPVQMKPSRNERHKGAGPGSKEKWRHNGLEQHYH